MEAYVNNPTGFLQNVLGACSITKTVLQAHERIPPDPDERLTDYRGDLDRMVQLCRDLALTTERLSDLRSLIYLHDQFLLQDRRATAEQEALAETLNRSYVAWCLSEFFEPAGESA